MSSEAGSGDQNPVSERYNDYLEQLQQNKKLVALYCKASGGTEAESLFADLQSSSLELERKVKLAQKSFEEQIQHSDPSDLEWKESLFLDRVNDIIQDSQRAVQGHVKTLSSSLEKEVDVATRSTFGARLRGVEHTKQSLTKIRGLKENYEALTEAQAYVQTPDKELSVSIATISEALDESIKVVANELRHAENSHEYNRLLSEGKVLIRENQLPHPPEHLGELKPESKADISLEYLTFMRGDPNILKQLMMCRATQQDVTVLGGFSDYGGVHTLAKSMQVAHTSIPFPQNALYQEGFRTGSALDQVLKEEITPGVYQDIQEYIGNMHRVSKESYDIAVSQFKSHLKEREANPPTTQERMEELIWQVEMQRMQFVNLQRIPGDKSVASGEMVKELTKELDQLLEIEEQQLLASAPNRSAKTKVRIESARKRYSKAEGFLEEQVKLFGGGIYAGPIASFQDKSPHKNAITAYLEKNGQALKDLQEQSHTLSREGDKAIRAKGADAKVIDSTTHKIRQLTEKVFAEQDRMHEAVALAYKDVSQKIKAIQEADRKKPPRSKEELDAKIAELREARSELAQIQEFSGPHTSATTAMLKDMDRSLGNMYLTQQKWLDHHKSEEKHALESAKTSKSSKAKHRPRTFTGTEEELKASKITKILEEKRTDKSAGLEFAGEVQKLRDNEGVKPLGEKAFEYDKENRKYLINTEQIRSSLPEGASKQVYIPRIGPDGKAERGPDQALLQDVITIGHNGINIHLFDPPGECSIDKRMLDAATNITQSKVELPARAALGVSRGESIVAKPGATSGMSPALAAEAGRIGTKALASGAKGKDVGKKKGFDPADMAERNDRLPYGGSVSKKGKGPNPSGPGSPKNKRRNSQENGQFR